MIQEDYVSFETAKLLKERGFSEWCSHCYGLDVRHNGETISVDEEYELKDEGKGDEIEYVEGGQFYNYWCNNKNGGELYAAPSLYVAIKWLRDNYNLHILVYPWKAEGDDKKHWCCEVYKSFCQLGYKEYTNETPKSYEDACEESIKYCLENLI